MNNFISTFSSLPQLGGLILNKETVYMCHYGGNTHVAPLWNWFPYNGHYAEVYVQNLRTTCSGKKANIFKNKSLFINQLG